MNKRKVIIGLGMLFSLMLVLSCDSDDGTFTGDIPFSADIFNSVNGKKVAFQGITNSAISWSWDFGDGTSSTERNPVHVYDAPGFYTAVLTAVGSNGESLIKEVDLALAITPYVLLTGGGASNGKTWKLVAAHSGVGDYLAFADADLTPFDPDITPLPDGAFGLFLDMDEVYEDEFTFYFDGNYKIDTKDGTAFSGIFYQLGVFGAGNITNFGGQEFGLVTGSYVPEDNLTFTFIENEDFTNPSAFGAITYSGVSTIDFSGNGFVGFLDFQRKVFLRNITNSSMQLVIFASLDPGAAAAGLSTNALVLTFEVVQ